MSNQLIVPQGQQLPAHLLNNPEYQALLARNQAAAGGIRAGSEFPTISVKGSKFHLRKDGQNTTMVDGQGLPMQRLEVVIMEASPTLSKVFFAGSYVEGQSKEPDCMSDDGVQPCGGSALQSQSCAVCPQNQWGSGRDQNNNPTKGKACSDTKKLVVLPAMDLTFPATLLQITPTSLKDWGAYVNQLTAQNIPVSAVITWLQFDPQASHPRLQFLFGGFLDDARFATVMERARGEDVAEVIRPRQPSAAAVPVQQPVQQVQQPVQQVQQPVQQVQQPVQQVQQPVQQVQQPVQQVQQPVQQVATGFGGPSPATQTDPAASAQPAQVQTAQVATVQGGQPSQQPAASSATPQTVPASGGTGGFGGAAPAQVAVSQPAQVVTSMSMDAGLLSALDGILGKTQG